jgi:hypothetical protein
VAPGGAETAEAPEMLRYPPSSVRAALLGVGFGLTAASYGAGMACGFGWDDVPGADALKVPVVGPWIALGQSGCAPDQDECDAMLVLRTILTVLDGLGQIGGLGLAAEGLFMTTEAEATVPASKAASEAALAPRLLPAPFVTGDALGASLLGRF